MADTTPITIQPLVLTQLRGNIAIVDNQTGTPLPALTQTVNNAWTNIIATVNAIATVAENADALASTVNDLVQQLIVINGLIVDVNGKLTSAAITNSYTAPTSVLTASTVGGVGTITIAAHQRDYTDGLTVSVDGGSLTGLTPGATYYVFYNDPARSGGAVTYHDSQTASDAAQVGGVHFVGSATISTTDGTAGGTGGTTIPGGAGGGGGGHASEV